MKIPWVSNWIKSFLKPSKIYIVIQRTEYEDGGRSSQICKVMSKKDKADVTVNNFNRDIASHAKIALVGLKIKRISFESLEYDLE